jgi:hypothetical protein
VLGTAGIGTSFACEQDKPVAGLHRASPSASLDKKIPNYAVVRYLGSIMDKQMSFVNRKNRSFF